MDIDQIDVYGNGDSLGYLQSLAEKAGKSVDFKGHTNEIGTVLSDNGYCGVIGLGRSAIERLALGLPCLFIGYEKIVGLVDKRLYEMARHQNFVPENYRDLGADEINKQLTALYEDPTSYILRERALGDFSISNIGDTYIRTIELSYAKCPSYANEIYKALTEMEGVEAIQLYNNKTIFNLMSSIIFSKTRNLNVKKMILITRLFDETENNYNHAEKMYSEIANQQLIQRQEINEIKTDLNNVIIKMNDITLKKLTKRHIGARVNWLRNTLKKSKFVFLKI